jgi:hypothetical protein
MKTLLLCVVVLALAAVVAAAAPAPLNMYPSSATGSSISGIAETHGARFEVAVQGNATHFRWYSPSTSVTGTLNLMEAGVATPLATITMDSGVGWMTKGMTSPVTLTSGKLYAVQRTVTSGQHWAYSYDNPWGGVMLTNNALMFRHSVSTGNVGVNLADVTVGVVQGGDYFLDIAFVPNSYTMFGSLTTTSTLTHPSGEQHGVRFQVIRPGVVTHLRCFRVSASAPCKLFLWSASNSTVQAAVTTATGPLGWENIELATLVAVQPGVTYAVTAEVAAGAPWAYSTSQAGHNADVTSNVVFKAGVYGPSSSTNLASRDAGMSLHYGNYFLDVVFMTSY